LFELELELLDEELLESPELPASFRGDPGGVMLPSGCTTGVFVSPGNGNAFAGSEPFCAGVVTAGAVDPSVAGIGSPGNGNPFEGSEL
jgi:hypothetical protein